MEHFLGGRFFKTKSEVETTLWTYFLTKPRGFYSKWIEKLVERWEHVIDSGGDYFNE
jgi:hypothetical protein